MNIGEMIKKIRKEKGLTQQQLGDLLGITQASVAKMESDHNNIRYDTLKKIASALEVDLSVFSDAGVHFHPGEEFLKKYNNLNDHGKQQADTLIDILSKVPEFKK